KEIDADFEQLKNGHSAIVIENVIYPDDQAGKYVETKVIDAKVGDTLTLDYYLYDEDEYVSIDDIEIAALTNQLPIGVNQPSLGDITVIVSEDTYNQLEQAMPEEINTNWMLFINSTDPTQTEKEISELSAVEDDHSIINLYEINKQDQQVIIVLSIFTYGFISLITLISVANILNTISTSIA